MTGPGIDCHEDPEGGTILLRGIAKVSPESFTPPHLWERLQQAGEQAVSAERGPEPYMPRATFRAMQAVGAAGQGLNKEHTAAYTSSTKHQLHLLTSPQRTSASRESKRA